MRQTFTNIARNVLSYQTFFLLAEVDVTRELGRKAKHILLNYANELPGQLQNILTPIKGKLVQERIINNNAVDLGVLGVSSRDHTTKLYSVVMDSLETNPDKFPKLITVLKSFPNLTTIANELEQTGKVNTFFYIIVLLCIGVGSISTLRRLNYCS